MAPDNIFGLDSDLCFCEDLVPGIVLGQAEGGLAISLCEKVWNGFLHSVTVFSTFFSRDKCLRTDNSHFQPLATFLPLVNELIFHLTGFYAYGSGTG